MKWDFRLAFDKLNEVTWAWPKRELQQGCIRGLNGVNSMLKSFFVPLYSQNAPVELW